MLINEAIAPMHRTPDALSEQVSQAVLGTRVRLHEANLGWRRVETPDGYLGWVPESVLMEPAALLGAAPDWEISDLWANLRAAPNYLNAPVLQAMLGVRLPLVDRAEGWAGLLHPDGRTLWTEAHRVRSVAAGPLTAHPRSICRTARRLLGVPYLWGGCTPVGIDCSGFMQLVMRQHGIPLLRDAGQQATQGLPLDRPEIADLVFFGPPDGGARITHVGLMLDDRRFIHASGSDRVRVDRLDRMPSHAFRLARRVLQR